MATKAKKSKEVAEAVSIKTPVKVVQVVTPTQVIDVTVARKSDKLKVKLVEHLTEKGASTIADLSKWAKKDRAKVARQLFKLQAEGIAKTWREGRVRKFELTS